MIGPWVSGSGPRVARLFHRLLSATFLVAWLSLLVQVRVLIGSRGLLPWGEIVDRLPGRVSWLAFPTLLRWVHSDAALLGGVWLGIAVAAGGLTARWPRLCAAASTVLYLSYTVAARTFFSFQWDNLIIESGLLACLLPGDRPAPWMHTAFRLLLFKLYFESGIAKFESGLGDWLDGSAMVLYYQTAPLPAGLAWWAHHLPVAWHHLESWGALVLELGVPVLTFGPRLARRAALGAFTGFQLLDIATANYGFFCYLSVVLSVFLLDDADLPGAPRAEAPPAPGAVRWARQGILAAWALVSLLEGWQTFAGGELGWAGPGVAELESARLVNTYHLFGSITRERIEPQFEEQGPDGQWVELAMHHKPGPRDRRPDWVAPHQPRVDFQLWFYGLSHRATPPPWVARLLERLCADPGAVAGLFATPLLAAPTAVRISFWDYQFTSPAERDAGAGWWDRDRVDQTSDIPCSTWGSTLPHPG